MFIFSTCAAIIMGSAVWVCWLSRRCKDVASPVSLRKGATLAKVVGTHFGRLTLACRLLLNAISMARSMAGCAGFLTLIQSGERPDL
jgi:hypothetical protein